MIHSIVVPMTLGFSVFLCGMKLMELALHRLAGPYLSQALQRATKTPLHGLAVGTVSTAFLQSSTAVTVISIGLVNAGLLSFPRTLGIILGTNIGTCLTTELIGLNIQALSTPLLTSSFAVWLLTALLNEARIWPRLGTPRWLEPLRSASVAVCGFGLLLAGLSLMQSIGPAVQESAMFDWFIEKAATGIWWGLAAGAVLTAAVHSSAAVIGLVMGFVTIGAMPPELGVALVLGANIGTCVTALLASIGGAKAGQFVAYAHTVLNIGGALLFLPLIGELTAASSWLSHSPASQIAHAQTIFNIACSILALPLCYMKAWRRLDTIELR
ncbi:Na/Pi cotransporter family protein [Paenibacillus paeoniae]|uniref:Na/Pi cotransporter family protein n=1 Tax=Paenibacillus paeoniae TaxID=2292705 RepID=A0A371PNS2_9BACL|nr:Na/Pi symporter [Paenibacillus paeoniae]REK77417.1 Na/Pi cotransporter family protein [Paenibacillus paeoniae]